jgi:Flp pilus assembly protein TadG
MAQEKQRNWRFVRRLRRDRSGIAAAEFAMVAPVMLSLYFGVTELTDAFICDSKVSLLASTAADLVAQDKEITNGEMTEIFNALNEVMKPYPASNTEIVVSSLVYDAPGQAKVAWSDTKNGNKRGVGSVVKVPDGLVSAGGSVIFAEVKHMYKSPAGELIYGVIPLTESFYMKPRKSPTVIRSP